MTRQEAQVRVIDGAGQFTRSEGTHWVEQLRVPDLSVGTYSIPAGVADDQEPHTEDEIYVVTAGRATFQAGAERAAVGPGSVIFVPAGEVHRFTDVTEDLATVVLFGPAEGSRAPSEELALLWSDDGLGYRLRHRLSTGVQRGGGER